MTKANNTIKFHLVCVYAYVFPSLHAFPENCFADWPRLLVIRCMTISTIVLEIMQRYGYQFEMRGLARPHI